MRSVSFDATSFPLAARGAARHALDPAPAPRGAHRRGHDRTARRDDAARWSRLGPATVTAVAPSARPLRLAWQQLGLPRSLRQAGIDVHHAPHHTMPLRTNVPRVVTVHDMTFFEHPEWHERAKVTLFRRAVTVAARRAADLVVPSWATAELLLARFAPAAPVSVVRHGVDHVRFRPDEDHPAIRRAS